MPVAINPPVELAYSPEGTKLWLSLQMSSRMHKGLARNAKQAGDKELARYHHGFEEGLLKAMKVVVEKLGEKNGN